MITPEQIAQSNTEHAHQAALFCWAASFVAKLNKNASLAGIEAVFALERQARELSWLFAIPNGDQRGDGSKRGAMIAGARLKAEGQKNGVFDIFLPVGRIDKTTGSLWLGLFIEMKKPGLRTHKNGGLSDDQMKFREDMTTEGYHTAVCYSWQEAKATVLAYLGFSE